mgnify:CR=1 FL=1
MNCDIVEWLLISAVGLLESIRVECVGLSGGEEDVFGIFRLFLFIFVVRAGVPGWSNMVHLSVLVYNDWDSVIVGDVSPMGMLLWVLMVGGWVSVVFVVAVMGMSVSLESIEVGELVPENLISDGLDLGLLSQGWLVREWKLKFFELDRLDWSVLTNVVLMSGVLI